MWFLARKKAVLGPNLKSDLETLCPFSMWEIYIWEALWEVKSTFWEDRWEMKSTFWEDRWEMKSTVLGSIGAPRPHGTPTRGRGGRISRNHR